MSLYNVVQLLLAGAVVLYAVRRSRTLSRHQVDDAPRRVAALLRAHLRGDESAEDGALGELGDRWLGRVCRAVLRPDSDSPGVDEVLLSQRYEASRGALGLRLAMTLGSVSGLAGALYQIAALPAARHSLLGLVPGLAERRAFEAGMLAAGLGVGIALFAGLSLRRLRRRADAQYRASVEAANRLEDALAQGDEPGERAPRVQEASATAASG